MELEHEIASLEYELERFNEDKDEAITSKEKAKEERKEGVSCIWKFVRKEESMKKERERAKEKLKERKRENESDRRERREREEHDKDKEFIEKSMENRHQRKRKDIGYNYDYDNKCEEKENNGTQWKENSRIRWKTKLRNRQQEIENGTSLERNELSVPVLKKEALIRERRKRSLNLVTISGDKGRKILARGGKLIATKERSLKILCTEISKNLEDQEWNRE